MDLAPLVAHQDGVVSRAQLLAAGLTANDVRRMIRRRDLAPVHPGVYVDHTGTPTERQRLWAAVLTAQGGVLTGRAAQRLAGVPLGPAPVDPIDLLVPWENRCRRRLDGVHVVRRRGLDGLVVVGSPPRLRLEDVTLDLVDAARDEMAVISEITRAVQSRRTTAARLLTVAHERPRLRRRRWVLGVLADVVDGACSVLEHGYLTRVERPHGLPVGRRQLRVSGAHGRAAFEDVEYPGGLVLELDGRLGHESAQGRDADFDRDLEAASQGRRTQRISYGQVFARACWTASRVDRLLRSVCGWDGAFRRCPSCPVGSIEVTP